MKLNHIAGGKKITMQEGLLMRSCERKTLLDKEMQQEKVVDEENYTGSKLLEPQSVDEGNYKRNRGETVYMREGNYE